MEKLQPFRFWCQKVLPLVYDDSLSYYETLCKVAKKLNEEAEAINTLSDGVSNLSETVSGFDNRIAAVETNFDTLSASLMAQFEALKTDVQNDTADAINTLTNTVDNKLADVDSTISALQTNVNALNDRMDDFLADAETKINNMIQTATADMMKIINDQLTFIRAYVETSEETLRVWVENRLDEFLKTIGDLTNPTAYNLITGVQRDNLDNVLRAFYNGLRSCALTAAQYDALKLSADDRATYKVEGNPRGVTALEFDVRGCHIFARLLNVQPGNVHSMRRNTTGETRLYKEQVLFNADLWRLAGHYTAEEWDALGKDAATLDALRWDALRWDWDSAPYLGTVNSLLTRCFDCAEIDEMSLDANWRDNLNITSYNFDNYSRRYLLAPSA